MSDFSSNAAFRGFRARIAKGPLAEAVEEASQVLAAKVAGNAPEDTGELRASVHATRTRVTAQRISSAVVVSSDHALAVEYGHGETDPDPFFRPAVASERPKMIAIIQRAAGPK